MNSVRAAYNRLSRWYDWLAGAGEARLRRLGLAALHLEPGENVLEVGCGTGQALALLAQDATGSRITGIDLSEGMLGVARSRLAKMGLAGRAGIIHGDALCLPFAGSAFDAIFLSFTLELFSRPDITRLLAECRRVLTGGGRVCAVALALPGKRSAMVALYSWFHRRFPDVVDCRPIPAAQWIAEEGFRVRSAIQQSLWGLPVEIVVAGKI